MQVKYAHFHFSSYDEVAEFATKIGRCNLIAITQQEGHFWVWYWG